MLQELPVRIDRSGNPDLHSTRGKVSRDLISVSSETSEQTDKFLHCGAEEAGGEKPHAWGGEGFN